MSLSARVSLHRLVRNRDEFIVEVRAASGTAWEGVGQSARDIVDDSVSFAIYARELREAGYPAASGGLVFEMLLQAEKSLRDVPAILGVWYPSSDNFTEYMAHRARGDTAEAAALQTFTGRQARKHGYSRVTCVQEQGGNSPEWVRVRFAPGGKP